MRESILLHEARFLTGRNRYRACEAAQAETRYRVFDGADPLAFIISASLRSRHLDESQRSIVAGRIASLKLGDDQHSLGSANLPTLPEADGIWTKANGL